MSDFTFTPRNTFDPVDVGAICKEIRERLLADRMGDGEWPNQREFIANKYNWTRSAQTLLRIHQSVSE